MHKYDKFSSIECDDGSFFFDQAKESEIISTVVKYAGITKGDRPRGDSPQIYQL